MNILHWLDRHRDDLSRSERRVANKILQAPEICMQSSIARLAESCEVSDPTVNRFCRNIGCSGFPDLKLKIAQALAEQNAQGTPFIHSAVQADDKAPDYFKKIFSSTRQALKYAEESIDLVQIEKAVSLLAQADNIHFMGLGGSASVTHDALHKFFRLGVNVSAHSDVLMQRMAAAAASPRDIAVLISNTGSTTALLDLVTLFHQVGCPVLALTSPQSPLAKICDSVIEVESCEDAELYTPSTTRIVQLSVIDVLATGLALSRGPEFSDHLKKIKSSLSDSRTNKAK